MGTKGVRKSRGSIRLGAGRDVPWCRPAREDPYQSGGMGQRSSCPQTSCASPSFPKGLQSMGSYTRAEDNWCFLQPPDPSVMETRCQGEGIKTGSFFSLLAGLLEQLTDRAKNNPNPRQKRWCRKPSEKNAVSYSYRIVPILQLSWLLRLGNQKIQR